MAGKADLVNGLVAVDGAWPWQLSQAASPGEFPWQLSQPSSPAEFPWQVGLAETAGAAPPVAGDGAGLDPFGG